MRHVPDGKLRRLFDEPYAVADAHAGHVEHCDRCSARREEVGRDAVAATALLSRPVPVQDIDSAWTRIQGAFDRPAPARRARPRLSARRHWRIVVIPVPSTGVIAGLAVVIAGAATATALTTVFSPATVAPVAVSSTDFQAVADVVGIGGSGTLGGFDGPSGTLRLPFGELRWTSAGRAHRVPSVAAAEAATGMRLTLPTVMPTGVGAPGRIIVQPEVTARIGFGPAAGTSLSGTTLTVTAGPAVLVEYVSSTPALGLPTLLTFAMEKPTASSTTVTSAQLEAFVLSRPGLPTGLAQEIRLLSDLGTTLQVPTPKGADVRQVTVAGSPGLLVSEASGAAAGVIWEDPRGVVHAALGLLDEKDILDVANQLG